jgi:hypothetical protein
MGTFLDDTAMLVIVAPLYVPLVGALGFDLIWYGVLYTITCADRLHDAAVWLQPVPDAGNGAAGNRLRDIYVLDHSVRRGHDAHLILVMLFPQIALWLPHYVYGQ